ncbi:MAG: hypothetical protein ACM3JD_19420 [Rudaea sp.]
MSLARSRESGATGTGDMVSPAASVPGTRTWEAQPGQTAALQERAGSVAAPLGWLPALCVVGAFGLLGVAIAFNGSRGGASWAEPVFWLGLLLLYVPIAFRVISAAPSRAERLGLVVFAGLGLYLVKIMQNPLAFTYPDEFVHQYNVDQILNTGHLFSPNVALPVTPLYPGLSTVTAALASLSGLGSFVSGLIVIAAARLILVLSLFLFIERISGSDRLGSIASMLYMTHPNFVFFSAEFSYESLALPLALAVAFLIAERESLDRSVARGATTIAAIVGIMAVIITHHLTSYALVAFFFGFAILDWRLSSKRRWAPWLIALFALAAASEWLFFVAGLTFSYLWPVAYRALLSIGQFFTGKGFTRELFTSSGGRVAPLWERAVGIGSVLVSAVGLPFGLWRVWNDQRKNPFALFLGGASCIYFGALALRFFPAAWEIANRASEFVFVGVSFVLALATVWLVGTRWLTGARQALLAAAFALLFVGGLVAGWSPNARLARPFLTEADGHTVEPQGLVASEWMLSFLGPKNRIASDPSNMHFLLTYGNQWPFSGNAYGIQSMMQATAIDQSVVSIIRSTGVRYILVDKRQISADQLVGVYLDRPSDPADSALLSRKVYGKWDGQAGVSRIYDSGNIVIYDVSALGGLPPGR